MKRSIYLWQLFGFGFTSLAGILLHFLYDWTGKSVVAGLFSAINESTWEHMKLLFWPMFIFACWQSLSFKDCENFWCIKMRGILLGLLLIPVIFYTYNGAVEKSPDWLNISIFFLTAAIVYIYEARQLRSCSTSVTTWCQSPEIAVILLIVIGVLFIVFTFKALNIGIFEDPLAARDL